MAVTKSQKSEILTDLLDRFARSKSVVFTKYRGLDMAKQSQLRSKLRAVDTEMKVAKKTLIDLAAKQSQWPAIDPSFMEGPVAAVFCMGDPLVSIKVLFDFSKENEGLTLLGGVVDGAAVGPDVIRQYAKLPSRNELLAKLLGSMMAPVSGTVGVFSQILGGFVRVLHAYRETLPAAADAPLVKPAAPVVESAPAETPAETPVAEESGEAPAENV